MGIERELCHWQSVDPTWPCLKVSLVDRTGAAPYYRVCRGEESCGVPHQEASHLISQVHHWVPSPMLTAPPALHETPAGGNCRPGMTGRLTHSMSCVGPGKNSELRPEGYLRDGGQRPMTLSEELLSPEAGGRMQ